MALYLLLIGVVGWIFFPVGLSKPLLQYLVLGERLNEGMVLYRDVIDDIGPLSAGLFSLLDWIFGRNPIVYEILGRVLIFLQAFYWNVMLIRYRVFQENTYLPALIFTALFQISFDLNYLSPQLLGGTFLVFALGQLFSQTVLQKETSESTLLIGLYGGIAAGFHLNYILFLPYLLLAGIAISGFNFRQVILSLVGFIAPILLILVFSFWNNSLSEIFTLFPFLFSYSKYPYVPWIQILAFIGLPFLLGFLGYVFSAFFAGSTINQQKQRQLIFIWLIFGSLEFFLVKRQAPFQLGILFPSLVYLITAFFIHGGNNLLVRFAFLLIVFGLPAYGWWFWGSNSSNSYLISESIPHAEISGRKILVWDDQPELYLNNSLGGPFLNPQLSSRLLASELSLSEKSTIYQAFTRQKPEFIFDNSGTFKAFLSEFPALQKWYTEKEKGVFQLK